jgi:DNA polymerase
LYRLATQAAPREGPRPARIVIVGEQPGDRALEDAGIARADVYATNTVKHFKFEERGKRRIHKKPATTEMEACFPWLAAELSIVRPRLLVCLGVTAAHAGNWTIRRSSRT